MATPRKSGAASKKAALTKDKSDAPRSVDPGSPGAAGLTPPAPDSAKAEARKADAERHEQPKPVKDAELTHGVDPITGGELDVDEARREGVPVMIPESKGDIRTDVTWPSHVQAVPVEQAAAGELTKANSSTSQRRRAQRLADANA